MAERGKLPFQLVSINRIVTELMAADFMVRLKGVIQNVLKLDYKSFGELVAPFHTGGAVKGSGLTAGEVPAILSGEHEIPRDFIPLMQHRNPMFNHRSESRLHRPGQRPAVVVKIDVRADNFRLAASRVRKQLRETDRALHLGRPLFGEELDD